MPRVPPARCLYQPVSPGRAGRLRCAIGVGQHAGEAPILIRDLLDHDVRVLWPLAEDADQRCGELRDDFFFLLARCAFGDLEVDVRHRCSPD